MRRNTNNIFCRIWELLAYFYENFSNTHFDNIKRKKSFWIKKSLLLLGQGYETLIFILHSLCARDHHEYFATNATSSQQPYKYGTVDAGSSSTRVKKKFLSSS